jgi:membrane protein required for colicin V production
MKLPDILHYLETISANIHFNLLDIFIIIIISAFSIYGLIRGFVKEIVSIISIVLGFYIALYWHEEAARYLAGFKNQNLQNILAFIIVFIVASLIVTLLGKLLSLALNGIDLGCINYLLGLVFGFVKGVFVVCVFLLALVSFLPYSNTLLANSQLTPAIISLTKTVADFSPANFKKQFTVKFDELKNVLKQASTINTLLKAPSGQPAAASTTTILSDSSER